MGGGGVAAQGGFQGHACTGRKASRAVPVPGPKLEQGAQGALVEQAARGAIAAQGAHSGTADSGAGAQSLSFIFT